eukprot:8427643-Prorocentrum_lima.AAC.1
MHGMHFTPVKRGAKCSGEANAARPLVHDVASPDGFAIHFVIALAVAGERHGLRCRWSRPRCHAAAAACCRCCR